MITHKLKIEPKYFSRILESDKKFEVRFNDRDYQVGDRIHFIPCTPEDKTSEHLERFVPYHEVYDDRCHWEIIYIHSGLGMAENYVVLGIKENIRRL
jgi:hypothetical protein